MNFTRLSVYLFTVYLFVRTDSAEGGGESQRKPTGGVACHIFMARNRAVLLGNQRFS